MTPTAFRDRCMKRYLSNLLENLRTDTQTLGFVTSYRNRAAKIWSDKRVKNCDLEEYLKRQQRQKTGNLEQHPTDEEDQGEQPAFV